MITRSGVAPQAPALSSRAIRPNSGAGADDERGIFGVSSHGRCGTSIALSPAGAEHFSDLEEDAMTTTRRRRTAALRVGFCMLVALTALGAMAVTIHASAVRATHATRPPMTPPPPASISDVDSALSRGDVSGAVAAWHSAYVSALSSRRWERLIEAGDAWLRIERVSGAPAMGAAKARELYLSALFRARQDGSAEGVRRAAAAFDALGDHEVAANAARMAKALEAHQLADNSVPVF